MRAIDPGLRQEDEEHKSSGSNCVKLFVRHCTNTALLAIALGLAVGSALAGSDGQDFSQIERGRYLAIAGDCGGCHTNDGGPAFAGGRPIETPFGTILATNVTPDRETGIGD